MSVNFLYGKKKPISASPPLSSSSETRPFSTSLSKGIVSILWKVVARRVGGRSRQGRRRAIAPALDGVAFP